MSRRSTPMRTCQSDGAPGAVWANAAVRVSLCIAAAVAVAGCGGIVRNHAGSLVYAGGDDVLAGGAGADRIIGGDGVDTVDYSTSTAGVIVDSIATDHPTDNQLVALAKQYFKKFDAMAADPTQV